MNGGGAAVAVGNLREAGNSLQRGGEDVLTLHVYIGCTVAVTLADIAKQRALGPAVLFERIFTNEVLGQAVDVPVGSVHQLFAVIVRLYAERLPVDVAPLRVAVGIQTETTAGVGVEVGVVEGIAVFGDQVTQNAGLALVKGRKSRVLGILLRIRLDIRAVGAVKAVNIGITGICARSLFYGNISIVRAVVVPITAFSGDIGVATDLVEAHVKVTVDVDVVCVPVGVAVVHTAGGLAGYDHQLHVVAQIIQDGILFPVVENIVKEIVGSEHGTLLVRLVTRIDDHFGQVGRAYVADLLRGVEGIRINVLGRTGGKGVAALDEIVDIVL